MKYINSLLSIAVIFSIPVVLNGAGITKEFQGGAIDIERKLENVRTNVRIELMKLPSNWTIDTPINADNYERYAAIMITLNCDYFRERMSGFIKRMRMAPWNEGRLTKASARVRMRFLGPWNEVLLEFFIVEGEPGIIFADKFYSSPQVTIDAITNELNVFINEAWLNKEVNPTSQPKHGEDQRAK